jgi:3-dehydroquinate synthase
MQTFKINNTTLQTTTEFTPVFQIKSHPENYLVKFDTLPDLFLESEIVLVDDNVKQLYNINHSKLITITAIEENKSIETVLDVCEQLTQYGFDKGNTLVVIGGGILQDIGAFTAKIYKRGINWKYYPTTLLSQADSCIGGKTALNYKNYKNQLALFSAPSEVIIDTRFIDTLKKEDIVSGYGEIVKLFFVGGEFYVNQLDTLPIRDAIFHSLMIKKAVIEVDEFEYDERKSLNYGHSFGHVIEPLTNYSIPHGEAVLLGMYIINKLFDNNPRITDIINRYTDIAKIKHISTNTIVQSLRSDKKVKNGIITFVQVSTPGVTTFEPTPIDEKLERKVYEMFVD